MKLCLCVSAPPCENGLLNLLLGGLPKANDPPLQSPIYPYEKCVTFLKELTTDH
jgi:hypothetical protein